MQLQVLVPHKPMSSQKPHRPSKSRSNDLDIPWEYVAQLQAMRKVVENNSRGLQKIESDVRGLQWRVSLATDSLVRRMEALEFGKESHVSQDRGQTVIRTTQKVWSKDVSGRLDALEATVKDLRDGLHLRTNDILAQTSTLLSMQELQTQVGCLEVNPPDALEAPSEIDPSHVMCLQRLQEKWDEFQATTSSGDGAEPFEGIAPEASTMTVLQVGKIDSEPWSSSDRVLGSAASICGHKASRFLVRRSRLWDTHQSIMDFVPQRVDASNSDTRTATAVGAESVEGLANEDCHLFSSKVLQPWSQAQSM